MSRLTPCVSVVLKVGCGRRESEVFFVWVFFRERKIRGSSSAFPWSSSAASSSYSSGVFFPRGRGRAQDGRSDPGAAPCPDAADGSAATAVSYTNQTPAIATTSATAASRPAARPARPPASAAGGPRPRAATTSAARPTPSVSGPGARPIRATGGGPARGPPRSLARYKITARHKPLSHLWIMPPCARARYKMSSSRKALCYRDLSPS